MTIGCVKRSVGAGATTILMIVAGCAQENPVQRVEQPELISTPSTPDGPPSVLLDSIAVYTTSAAHSSAGHTVQHQFDWGDGRLSGWKRAPKAATRWQSLGTRGVRARARCEVHTDAVSDWSQRTSVSVAVEAVSQPLQPVGVQRLCADATAAYASGGAISDVGHPVEYQFDWGDGLSPWSTEESLIHGWVTPGSYDCRVRARCALDPGIVTDWTSSTNLMIEEHSGRWIIETDLQGLIGSFGSHGNYVTRTARVTYDGPLARLTRLKLELTGRASGTTCRYDDSPPDVPLSLILWWDVWNDGKEAIWAPLGMFFGMPAANFVDAGYWGEEGIGDNWDTPKILAPGDILRVRTYIQLEDYPGCGRSGFDFCDVYGARLFVELECTSE